MKFPIAKFRVSGPSMSPTINSGDFVVVNRWAYLFSKPKIGDIVVIRHPTKRITMVKRIKKIKLGAVFVVGDDKQLSTDSRNFGYVPTSKIIGKVIFRT